MIGAAVTFLAVAIADLTAGGLGGTPVSRRRAVLGILAAAFVMLAGGWGAGWTMALVLVLTASLAGVSAWLLLRSRERLDPRRAWVALAALIAYLALGVGAEALWDAAPVDWLDRWLETLAFPALNMMEADSLLLIVALFLFLTGTANGVVRTVLIAAGTETERSEERLRGGRIIGVLERWMILALMLAGETTAAGLVVSAKSILRFPELTRAAGESAGTEASAGANVDHVTEYFLLGSLVSWLMAALLALLFVGPF